MEFDTDWIWLAIFVGVMLIRAVGSRIARSARNTAPKIEASPEEKESPGFGPQQIHRAEEQPTPIEPR